MLIDEFLPSYDVVERHSIRIRANSDTVYSTIKTIDLNSSPVIRLLFYLRGMSRSCFDLNAFLKTGFILLGEIPNQEILLGIVGQFWKYSGRLQQVSPDEFKMFRTPGFIKAVMNFSLVSQGERDTILSTQTRVLCLDLVSRRSFRRYWFLVGPFSGWIRKEMLRIIKKKSEK